MDSKITHEWIAVANPVHVSDFQGYTICLPQLIGHAHMCQYVSFAFFTEYESFASLFQPKTATHAYMAIALMMIFAAAFLLTILDR